MKTGRVIEGDSGGDRGARTPNLGIANAALSQLSYIPTIAVPVHYTMSGVVLYNTAARSLRALFKVTGLRDAHKRRPYDIHSRAASEISMTPILKDLSESQGLSKDFAYIHCGGRYCNASARCSISIFSDPAKSAMVRANFNMR